MKYPDFAGFGAVNYLCYYISIYCYYMFNIDQFQIVLLINFNSLLSFLV
jgi:hypothetical protein